MPGFKWKTAATAVLSLLTLALGLAAGSFGQEPVAPRTKGAFDKSKTKTAAKRLDLNKATAEEMVELLPGVGEVTAKKIVAGRPYAAVDDLTKAGVPAHTVETIRPLVVVHEPTPAKTKGEAPKVHAATSLVNLNTATPAELETLPGVGPALAAAITAGRPYKTVDDLDKVKGLGAVKLKAIHDLVTVSAAPVAEVAGSPVPKGTMVKKAAGSPVAKKAQLAPGQVVNINTAPREVLDLLPGIGPVKSQAIVEGRPFKTKEDVMKVKGIKEGEFAKIKDLITVN
jgi:competence protein ComEA